MQDLIYLIAFISTCWYGCHLLADCMIDNRPIASHLGYGLISIFSTWYCIPTLSITMILIVFCYTVLTLFVYLDKTKENKRKTN